MWLTFRYFYKKKNYNFSGVCRKSKMVMQLQSVDLKQSDHCCVNIDGATVFNIISEISLYLDSFLQVEERLCCCCLAFGEMLELEEWIQGGVIIFSTKNVNHILILKL